jgi:protein-tyrosine phosphatase
MIDLHNHILYDWDDGPATLDKTLEMARQAVTVGTTIMAATPHRRWNGGESRPDQVRRRVREVNDIFALNGILLTLVPGIEIPIEPGMASDLMRGDVSTIGDGKYALVEPPFTELPEHLLPSIKEVIDAGYGVVIAHPERNSYVQKSVAIGKSLDFLSSCADRQHNR